MYRFLSGRLDGRDNQAPALRRAPRTALAATPVAAQQRSLGWLAVSQIGWHKNSVGI